MFEHLILLIGTNPLPNFVVAEYFIKANTNLKDIYLVYSEEKRFQRGTNTEAQNLKKLLSEKHTGLKLHAIPLSDVSSATEIIRDIKKGLLQKLPQKSSVHFNYTGGTKAMSIHIYNAIEQEIEKCSNKSYSYLDARHFCIVDDDKNVITNDLRQEIYIDFMDMIGIHGFGRKDEKESIHDFTQAVAIFCRLIEQGDLGEYVKNYKREIFLKKDRDELICSKSQIKAELKFFKANGAFLEVISAMPEDYQLFSKEGNFTEPQTNNYLKCAVKFLDGAWLEEYVYKIFEKAFKDSKIKTDKNWRIKKNGWSGDFELDVILINGYQLIGISCTTSDKKHLCKSKGFEIIHRTQQIGGEEAKAVLITTLEEDKKKALQEELAMDTGGRTNIHVLGIADLKEEILLKEIKEFIANE